MFTRLTAVLAGKAAMTGKQEINEMLRFCPHFINFWTTGSSHENTGDTWLGLQLLRGGERRMGIASDDAAHERRDVLQQAVALPQGGPLLVQC